MKINLTMSLFFGTSLILLAACNWNRTEEAQQQNYASGPDAPYTPVSYTHLTLPTILLV